MKGLAQNSSQSDWGEGEGGKLLISWTVQINSAEAEKDGQKGGQQVYKSKNMGWNKPKCSAPFQKVERHADE